MSTRIHRGLDLGINLLNVWDEHADWSRATFGTDEQRGPRGPLRHLAKEAKEAAEARASDMPEELADCQLLIWDAARRAGFTPEDIVRWCDHKLRKNKDRIWPEAEPDQPVEHVRSSDT